MPGNVETTLIPGDQGFVVWLTGLPAAGKTSVANELASEIALRGLVVEQLDGDAVRRQLSRGLGFSDADRKVHVLRIGWVASRVARAGAAVIVSAISPCQDVRLRARHLVEETNPFVEVHVSTPLSECVRRDPKGLYDRALCGKISNFTGVSSPYEIPADPDLRLDTTGRTPEESAKVVLAALESRHLVPSMTPAVIHFDTRA